MSLRHYEVAIAGAGFAGLGMAVRLRQEGVEDFVLLERSDALGGTWRDNHYPGCACDVPTPLYSFSFAPNPRWGHLYARSAEIRAYMEDCADRFGVRPHLSFGADVTGAHWDAQAGRWTVLVGGEPALTARMLVGCFGGLSRPSFPRIEGIGDFEGPLFHSAEWDHEVSLAGKRVGVIGTGASAIQLVPRVAREAERLTVFQRTPPWIMPQLDRRIGPREQALYARAPMTQKAVRGLIFAITEGIGVAITRKPRAMVLLEAAAKALLRRQVPDPVLRRRLTPSYRLGCKRILVSNDYLPSLSRPNVDLVSSGIARITRRGVLTHDGTDIELDVLVCATGFAIEEVFAPLDLRGIGGLTLGEAWADGIEAHRGTTLAGFPNLALLSGPNTGTGSTSQVYMIEAQFPHVLEMVRRLRTGAGAIHPRPEAQRAYNDWVQQQMTRTVWLQGGCKSWYLSDDGVNRTLYPGPSSSFARSVRRLNEAEYVIEPSLGDARVGAPVAVAAR
jgi:cation diffusion facilitator CzcD-associated flavoprotein CzcO